MTGKEQTAAARKARTLAKWRRWAGELSAAGWIVGETIDDTVAGLSDLTLWDLKEAAIRRCNEIGLK